MSATSSAISRRWSQASPATVPSAIAPGTRLKRSHTSSRRAAGDPSIWWLDVAAPHRNPSGNCNALMDLLLVGSPRTTVGGCTPASCASTNQPAVSGGRRSSPPATTAPAPSTSTGSSRPAHDSTTPGSETGVAATLATP